MIAVSFVITLLSLALPLGLLQVYDRIIPNEAEDTLRALVFGVGLAIAIETGLRVGRSYLTNVAAARFEHETSMTGLDRLLHAPIARTERDSTGRQLERFHAIAALKDLYSGQLLLAALDLGFAGVYLAILAYLAGSLVAVPLLCFAGLFAASYSVTERLEKEASTQSVAEEKHSTFVIRVLRAIHTVKALGGEAPLCRRFEQLQEDRAAAAERLVRTSQSQQDLAAVVGQVAMVAVVGLGSVKVMGGEMTTGALAASTLLVGRALQPMQGALGLWRKYQNAIVARARADELLGLPQETQPSASEDEELVEIRGEIEIRSVAYRLSGQDHDLLSDITLVAKPGDWIGITGPNGGGKSALLSLLSGLETPTEGEVFLDGQPMAAHPSSLRAQSVALVAQNESLFRGSILENMTMFRQESEARAMDLADRLGFGDQVRAMPNGFRTRVGSGSSLVLPRGLAQRIAIVRALATQPKVLLFDEANSMVDDASDRALREVLKSLRASTTIVMVSHRPSFLRMADHVLALEDGRLESIGGPKDSTPEETAQ